LLHFWPLNMAELKHTTLRIASSIGTRSLVEVSDLPAEFATQLQQSGETPGLLRAARGLIYRKD